MRTNWEELKKRGLLERVVQSNKNVLIPDDVIKSIKLEQKEKEKILKNSNTDLFSHPQNKILLKIKEEIPDVNLIENYNKAIPKRKFEIDIALIDYKIAIEVDGFRSHGISKAGFDRDRKKDRLLQLNGWLVYRFTAKEINSDIDMVISEIKDLINYRKTLAPPLLTWGILS